jgi:hypothetical protein
MRGFWISHQSEGINGYLYEGANTDYFARAGEVTIFTKLVGDEGRDDMIDWLKLLRGEI